jgi:hypothetical protein
MTTIFFGLFTMGPNSAASDVDLRWLWSLCLFWMKDVRFSLEKFSNDNVTGYHLGLVPPSIDDPILIDLPLKHEDESQCLTSMNRMLGINKNSDIQFRINFASFMKFELWIKAGVWLMAPERKARQNRCNEAIFNSSTLWRQWHGQSE